jgi:O-antigen ligase
MNTLWWQVGLEFTYHPVSKTISSYIKKEVPGIFPIPISVFYQKRFDKVKPFFLAIFFISVLGGLLMTTIHAPTQRLILFSVALSLAVLPLYKDYSLAPMMLIMIIAFIYNKSRRFIWQPIFCVLCAIYLMNVIGLLYTGDFNLGIKRLDTTVVLVLFPVIFSMTQLPKKNIILLLRFFVWSVIAFCVFELFSYAIIVHGFTWNAVFRDSKLFAPFLMMWPAHPHPSYLSTILLMAIPIALYLRYDNQLSIINYQLSIVETFLGVVLPIVFTILAGARVGMVIVPVLLLLGYLFYCKLKPLLKWGLLIAGVIASGFILQSYLKNDNRFADPIRVDLRKTAISAIKEKPVFGWGTGYVEPLIHSEERAHSLGIEKPYSFNQFHNQYLEDTVQFGITGILILLLLFGWLLWIGIREKNFLLLSLLVIYIFFCWTETVFFVAKGVTPFTFWFCFLMSNRNQS